MTGWSGRIPREGLLPVTGGYADGYWEQDPKSFLKSYLFEPIDPFAVQDNMGALEKGAKPQGSRPIQPLSLPLLRERRRHDFQL